MNRYDDDSERAIRSVARSDGGGTTVNIGTVELRDEQDLERWADDNQRMTRLQTRHG